MGLLYQTIAGRATNPAALTALTANTGDSFVVQAFNPGAKAVIEQAWAAEATVGVLRIRSPKMHDNVQNLRLTVPSTVATALFPPGAEQMVFSQDTLTVEISGGGAETDVGCVQLYYSDVPGASQRLATWDQVKPRIVDLLTMEVDTAGATTLGDWSAGTAVNNTFDLLKANTDYAVLGYVTSVGVAAVALAGPDTSNFKCGGPGGLQPLDTRNWFVQRGLVHGTPHIPIINSANKGATNSYQCSNAAGATNNIQWFLAQLSPTA